MEIIKQFKEQVINGNWYGELHAKLGTILDYNDRSELSGYREHFDEHGNLNNVIQLFIRFIDTMMDKYEFIDIARKNMKLSNLKWPAGAVVVFGDKYVVLESRELGDLYLKVGTHRNLIKNRELALKLFELALEDYCDNTFKYKSIYD